MRATGGVEEPLERGTEAFDHWLSVFASVPGVGVAIVSDDLRLEYANAAAARLYSTQPADEIRGKHLSELFPPPWMEEREPIFRRILAGGRPVVVRSILRGKQIESTAIPLSREDGQAARVLVVTIEGQTPEHFLPEGMEVVESRVVDLGNLAALTPRELEVLALIGQGQSAKEIAAILNCSPRTVERHRDSIGKKLDKDDRVKLAIVARTAGLELRDAQLNRIAMPGGAQASGGSSIHEVKPTPAERAVSVQRDGNRV